MRELVKEYLGGNFSRRNFIHSLTVAGFSLAAARSALGALEPIVQTQNKNLSASGMTTFVGTGGESVAEQLLAFGTRFLFVCNSSGMGPLCDALIDRPQLQFIQAVSEHQTAAIADGFANCGLPSIVLSGNPRRPAHTCLMFESLVLVCWPIPPGIPAIQLHQCEPEKSSETMTEFDPMPLEQHSVR